MKPLPKLHSAAIAALLLASGPVQAQQQDLTAEDVQSYVEQIREDAARMMDAQDPQQLIEWTERNLAEGATFQVSLTIVSDGEHKAYSSTTVDTQDILRMVGVLAGAFQQGAFRDYSLKAEVGDVVSHGPGAATARIRWTERFTLNAAGLLGESGTTPEGEGLSVEAEADCSHLLQREQDRMQIGLTTCTVEMRL